MTNYNELYLENLVEDYPMNDYVKNGKERKHQRKKELAKNIAFQVVGGILVLAFISIAITAEWWAELIV